MLFVGVCCVPCRDFLPIAIGYCLPPLGPSKLWLPYCELRAIVGSCGVTVERAESYKLAEGGGKHLYCVHAIVIAQWLYVALC